MGDLRDEKQVLEAINEFLPQNMEISKEQTEALVSLFNGINKILVNSKNLQNNSRLAREFLVTAKQHLEASRALLSKNIYNLSVFHLQQTVEKTTKALGLSFFLFGPSDLRGKNGIGHMTPLAFVKMLEREWVDPYLNLIQSIYRPSNSDIAQREKLVRKFENLIRKNRRELARLNGAQLKEILQTSASMKKTMESAEIDQKIFAKIDELSSLLESYPELSDGVEKLKQKFTLDLVKNFIDLYLLSIITYPHFDYTRYPDLEITPNEYGELGITKVSPKIFGVVESSINQITKHLAES